LKDWPGEIAKYSILFKKILFLLPPFGTYCFIILILRQARRDGKAININEKLIAAMRYCVVAFFFIATSCYGQYGQWELDIMAGVSGYKGDLTQKQFMFRTMRPATGVNIRYNYDNNFVVRAGIALGWVSGNDRYNTQPDIHARNLRFQSQILEGSICIEYNLLEPEIFFAYPYVFAGVGVFHFDPYAFDDNGKKTYLQPLSTEGQGLPDYPDRKPYKRTQFCIPFGAGWKVNIHPKMDIVYELGFRGLFTDYLDDVSTTFVNPQKLLDAKGPKAVEMSARAKPPFAQDEGEIRGNPDVKDWYFINGIKLLIRLGKD
jgi:hypothetical protein